MKKYWISGWNRRQGLGRVWVGMDGESRSDLGKDVLRDVSRSFYLTLRALPAGMRSAVSVGYLLARASDTIADCEGERGARLVLLDNFRAAMSGRVEEDFFEKAAEMAEEKGVKEGERVLLRRLQEVFGWWQSLAEEEGKAVREVVRTITLGQSWDLERFPEGKVVSLSEGEEVEEYCYRVAGCVGEFWTEIGFGSDPSFSNKSKEEMRGLGKRFGKGLQLVNILRDKVEDEKRGRCYLPGERSFWLRKARGYLEDGLDYSRAVRGRRARLATVLPALIGLETLLLLEKATEEELAEKVKVGRPVVRRCLWRAIWF